MQERNVCELLKTRPRNNLAEHCGPRAALRKLAAGLGSHSEKQAYIQQASLDAILGACPKTMDSLKCGIRCYEAYVDAMNPNVKYYPPELDTLLSWSTLFRSDGTWANYVGYVRTACILVNAPVDVFREPAMKRAKVAIKKRCLFESRPNMFLQANIVKKMMRWALKPDNVGYRAHSFLFLISYVFLLRLPSEALPLTAGQACIYVEEDELVLELVTRKNKLRGSKLRRACWCKNGDSVAKATCPMHVLAPVLKQIEVGAILFKGITAGSALATLRYVLGCLEVDNAEAYRTHDLRRGHARDLQQYGASLHEILEAGEWRSPAFLKYLDVSSLERDSVLEAHLNESSDDEE